MANTIIQLKHSTVTGNVPASLANGEISINSRDGKLFYSTPLGVVTAFNPYPGPSGLDTELQFNDGGSLGGSEKLTFNKTTGLLTVNGTVRANIFSDDGVDLYDFSNNAFNRANASFSAANAAAAIDTTQNNSITAAFIAANSAGVYANGAFAAANLRATTANASIAWNTANAAFVRANNSLDANNGGTVTGTITATAFITTGAFGNITGANTIYANNFVANTGFIQFSDGSRQFTANAGSGGGTTDTFARNQANAAFSAANTAQSTATSAEGTASSAASAASGAQSTATTANDTATSAFIQANAAFIKANTGTGNASFADYFPTGDWGNLTDAASSAFGEDLTVMYDCRVDPITPRGYLLSKDFGYVA